MLRLLTILFAAALSTACAKTVTPTQCHTDSQCPDASRCQAGVCTADQRPVASIRPVATIEAFALAELDGTASHDPDPGDVISEHLWTVRALDAACQAPEVASHGPRPFVRFPCAGRYEVSLAVRDALGVESAPATGSVHVLPPSGAPVVAAGPDLATEHVCAGSPLTCGTEEGIALTAAAAPGLSLRWSVLPPADRPLDGTRRVRFLPDAAAATPIAVIETDGTAISGDWIFRVEARDAYGVVGAAHTRVSVRNRAPVVTIAPAVASPHVFDPARSSFLSSGELAWSVVDPDGDPVDVTATWRHVGDGGASFDGEITDTTVTFAVEVPYGAPEDALLLRGGLDLSRRIEIAALDVNRTEGRTHAEIEIGNRPPVFVGGASDSSVPHRFDRAGSRYVATARAGTFVDPDGDPLLGGTAPGPCGTVVVDGNDATVVCAVPFEGVPALDQLVGRRTFTVPVRDAWDVAANVPVRTVEITNSPPRLTAAPAPAATSCTVWLDPPQALHGGCVAKLIVGAVDFDAAPEGADPDGDPILVSAIAAPGGSVSPAGAILSGPGAVPFHFSQPSYVIACTPEYQASFLVASDGVSSVRLGVSPAPANCQ
jgi:hypothetical protein